MKVHLDELDKYIRTNKITVYDIYSEGRKQPVYSSSDELTIEETITKALDTFESMPSGLYKFKGKKSPTASNNTYQEVDVLVGNYNDATAPIRANSNNQRMPTFTQDDIDRHVKQAIELREKDFELKECKRMYDDLSAKFKLLASAHEDLEDYIDDLVEILKLEGVKKSKIGSVVNDGITTVLEHGTKAAMKKFGKLE